MPHRYNGTWSHFKIADTGNPPNRPVKGDDFVLVANDAGALDASQSTVDRRTVQSGRVIPGNATDPVKIDLIAEGRRYVGFQLKEFIAADGGHIYVVAGRFGPVAPPPQGAKPKGKGSTGVAADGQEEGTWVATKP